MYIGVLPLKKGEVKNMAKSKFFLSLSLSFIGGVFCASFYYPKTLGMEIVLGLVILAVIIFAVTFRGKIEASIEASIAASILMLALGIFITSQSIKDTTSVDLDGKEYSGKAIVAKEPEQKEGYQSVIIKLVSGERVLINTNQFKEIKYGDELNLQCVLKIPENKTEEFDYKMYLAKDRIYYLCQNAKIESAGENKGNKIYSFILNLKNRMAGNINSVIPYPYSALGNGLIFGGSSELSKNLKDNFSRTGMTHIIAVSGYNVTIIAEYLILFGIWIGLWRKQAFWFALVGVILFVAMVGFPSSAVRAGVMGSLLLWAMKNGRLANSWNAIIFAAAVMLIINPLLLRWDIGFQLSFLATIGIVALAPFWEKHLVKKHRALGFTEIFFLSLSAQIFVIPIIIYNFHTLSLISLAANLLILPIIPLSMLLVFLTAVSGFIFPPLSLVFAWLTFLPLRYEIEIINILSSLKWASREVNNFSFLMMIIWYLILTLTIISVRRVLNRKSKEKLFTEI
jgi:competence protein ComEC